MFCPLNEPLASSTFMDQSPNGDGRYREDLAWIACAPWYPRRFIYIRGRSRTWLSSFSRAGFAVSDQPQEKLQNSEMDRIYESHGWVSNRDIAGRGGGVDPSYDYYGTP